MDKAYQQDISVVIMPEIRETPETAGEEKRPKTRDDRHNKIYRAPSTPPPEKMLEMEKGFVLDCGAASSISWDYSKTNPKLGPVIPPYNSQLDGHVRNYFTYEGVNKTLENTDQVRTNLTTTKVVTVIVILLLLLLHHYLWFSDASIRHRSLLKVVIKFIPP